MEQITVMTGQVGIFLGETAEYLGEHWWVWLVCAAASWLVFYSFVLMKRVFVCILDDEAAEYGEREDPEPPVLERSGLSALRTGIACCKVYGFVFKYAGFAFCSAFVVSVGYLFMDFIYRFPYGG